MTSAALVAAFAVSTACGGPADAPALAKVVLAKDVVVDGLRSPWAVTFLSAEEALVTEKHGGLLRIHLQTKDVVSVSGLPGDLVDDIGVETPSDNGGLFDVALDPDFAANRRIYLSYAAKGDGGRTTKVVRGVLEGYALTDLETLLVAEPYTDGEYHHYGGGLIFGADGMLYITIGERLYDERDEPDLPIAQDVADRRGKIYRLTPDGRPPADNPDFGAEASPGLYALGVRAAQGLALHPETGDIWFSEHGTRQGDEINRLRAGANYGWPIRTSGGYRHPDYAPPEIDADFTAPEWHWLQTVAPTGLVFYRGTEFPTWRDDLIVSGLSRGSLWRIKFENRTIVSVEELFVHDRARSRDVAVSPDGALYMLTDTLFESGEDGRLRYTGEPGGSLIRIRNAASAGSAGQRVIAAALCPGQ
ncbi:MAG: PQQ-dependent sugar dehydrogenase [Pseudomonadota bacterium]